MATIELPTDVARGDKALFYLVYHSLLVVGKSIGCATAMHALIQFLDIAIEILATVAFLPRLLLLVGNLYLLALLGTKFQDRSPLRLILQQLLALTNVAVRDGAVGIACRLCTVGCRSKYLYRFNMACRSMQKPAKSIQASV